MPEWVDMVNGKLEARVTRRSFERVWKRNGWKLKSGKTAPKNETKSETTTETEPAEPPPGS